MSLDTHEDIVKGAAILLVGFGLGWLAQSYVANRNHDDSDDDKRDGLAQVNRQLNQVESKVA